MNNCFPAVVTGIKAPSPSQLEEMKESRGICKIILGGFTFSVVCGIFFTLVGLKLIKMMVGVDSFGFQMWTWLGIHFIIFWMGVAVSVVCFAFIVFAIVLLARLCRAT